jgi:hypothetical protein
MDQLEPVDEQVFVLAQGDGRSPPVPASRTFARVQGGAQEAEDDVSLGGHGRI